MRHVGLFCVAFVAMMLLVLLAFLAGALSTMGMAVAYILLISLGILVLSRIIKSSTSNAGSVQRPLAGSSLSRMILSTRVLRILIVVSICTLGYGIWSTQGAPLLPRITGITANICMTTAFIIALRKSKRDSKR